MTLHYFQTLRIACHFRSGKVFVCLLVVGLTAAVRETYIVVPDSHAVVPKLLGSFFDTNIPQITSLNCFDEMPSVTPFEVTGYNKRAGYKILH